MDLFCPSSEVVDTANSTTSLKELTTYVRHSERSCTCHSERSCSHIWLHVICWPPFICHCSLPSQLIFFHIFAIFHLPLPLRWPALSKSDVSPNIASLLNHVMSIIILSLNVQDLNSPQIAICFICLQKMYFSTFSIPNTLTSPTQRYLQLFYQTEEDPHGCFS